MSQTISDRFKWAVQALAQPSCVQLSLFPSFAEVADELALEHEETQAAFLAQEKGLSVDQYAAIADLDGQLARMSGPENAKVYWTVEALDAAPEWAEVRLLAHRVLDAMGWQHVAPPLDRGALFASAPEL